MFEIIFRGQTAKLSCNYDLEGDKLYSIKWYRNRHEFYRWIKMILIGEQIMHIGFFVADTFHQMSHKQQFLMEMG